MDDGVVQADAGRPGKAVQPLEVGGAAVLDDELIDQLVQLPGGHAGLDMLAAVLEGGRTQGVGPAHPVQFFCVLDLDQCRYASKAFMTSAVVASTVVPLSTTASLPRLR